MDSKLVLHTRVRQKDLFDLTAGSSGGDPPVATLCNAQKAFRHCSGGGLCSTSAVAISRNGHHMSCQHKESLPPPPVRPPSSTCRKMAKSYSLQVARSPLHQRLAPATST